MQSESLKIFSIISQIEQILEGSPRPKIGSGNRRMVDVDLMFDLLGDLKVTIPEDIRRANSLLIEQSTLLEHANEEADELVAKAQADAISIREQTAAAAEESRVAAEREYQRRVAEHEVLQEAQRRADILQQKAERNANIVYNGAKQYADELLADVQRYLMEYHGRVAKNRAELDVEKGAPDQAPAASQMNKPPQAPPPAGQQPPARAYEQDDMADVPTQRKGLFQRRPVEIVEPAVDEDELDEDEEKTPRPRRRGFLHKREDDALDMDLEE